MRKDIKIGLLSFIYDFFGSGFVIAGITLIFTMVDFTKLSWVKIALSCIFIALGITLTVMAERNWILNYNYNYCKEVKNYGKR